MAERPTCLGRLSERYRNWGRAQAGCTPGVTSTKLDAMYDVYRHLKLTPYRAIRGTTALWRRSFFVTEDALRRITNVQQFDESGILSAFDLNRNLIHAIAAKVYGRGRKGSYELVAADF